MINFQVNYPETNYNVTSKVNVVTVVPIEASSEANDLCLRCAYCVDVDSPATRCCVASPCLSDRGVGSRGLYVDLLLTDYRYLD